MWARVRGKTENDLLKLPLRGSRHLSSRVCSCGHGRCDADAIGSRLCEIFMTGTLYPLLTGAAPDGIETTGEDFGRAMINVARRGLRVVNPGKR